MEGIRRGKNPRGKEVSTLDADGTALVSDEVATEHLHGAGRAAHSGVLSTGETVSLEGPFGREVGATVSLFEPLVALDVSTHQESSLAQSERKTS
mmetsp:Transcript_43925/g.71439  ORF Transcript_43925/g.71439 Transcript_43925/m.71439 type:complete len:95 (+) Transcript_43925:79-363(+)